MKMDELTQKYYNEVCNMETIAASLLTLPTDLLRAHKERTVFLCSDRYVRKLLSVFGLNALMYSAAEKQAREFFVQYQVFAELVHMGVTCYMFARPEMKELGCYSELAAERIKSHAGFPVMAEDYSGYKAHFDEILGEKSSAEYVANLRRIPQIVLRDGLYGHEDSQSPLVNTIGGHRVVTGAVGNAEHRLHVYGRCGVFGYAVEDADTIPSCLQQEFIKRGVGNTLVVNHGLWGADDNLIINNLAREHDMFKRGDVVIIYEHAAAAQEICRYEKLNVHYFDCTQAFHEAPNSAFCFYDRPGHMSGDGYHAIARYIYQCLNEVGAQEQTPPPAAYEGMDYISEYLRQQKLNQFDENLQHYISQIKEEHPLKDNEKKLGAIVMNCNPFTKGHRYLIEYASARVDRLYVFVLQEDKSFFPFAERFELVRQGTADLKNVIVLPSGEFMISSLTFPEYFMKEYKKDKQFDVTKDLYTFTRVIAPGLGISVRFAGQEPLDIVTREYNEKMRSLLPEAGLEFCEIPRLTTDGEQVVSASLVRKLLKERNWLEIDRLVPTTTMLYLQQKFGDKKNAEADGEPRK